MSKFAIRAEQLGKKYSINHFAEPAFQRDFREDIVGVVRGVGSWARRVLSRDAPRPGRTTEEFWALRGLDFEVSQGEVVGIIGRNGAGKSTLLKVLSRITEPSTGRVELNGRVASLLEVGTGFHPELTGRENVYLNGTILGMSRAEIRKKFDGIVDFAGVERFLDTPVKRYSSGMYVRLAFAVASHLEPEVLIIDEVLAVGDLEFQKKCLGRMGEVANEGRTILFVSHSLPMVASLCTRCILLDAGQIVVQGETNDVLRRYQAGGGGVNPAVVDLARGSRRIGDDYVQLTEIRVVGETGRTALDFSMSESFSLLVRFTVLQPLRKAPQPNVHVTDASGNYVLVSSPHDWAVTEATSPGGYLATCSFPANFLNDGLFSLSVAINHFENGLVTACFERDALTISVVDKFEDSTLRRASEWAGRIPGVVRPILPWSIEDGGA